MSTGSQKLFDDKGIEFRVHIVDVRLDDDDFIFLVGMVKLPDAYPEKVGDLFNIPRSCPISDPVDLEAFESECAARKGLDDTRSCRRGQLIGILGKDDRITGEDLNRSRRRE